MKIKILFFLISPFMSGGLLSQSSLFWGSLEPGKHAVGIKDTVLFKENEMYAYKDYEGAKPFFVKIWYPANADEAIPFINYGDYLELSESNIVPKVSAVLSRINHKALEHYGVRDELDKMKTISYGISQRKLNKLILETPVKAQRDLTPAQGKFPCIYYHHGLGGTAEENSVICEFLASHGFMVISSNYFWPYKKLIGNTYHRKYPSEKFDGVTDIEFVVDQISKMPTVDSTFTAFMGHSWGAQMGLYLNPIKSKPFDFHLLFDSTLERYELEDAKKKNNLKGVLDFIDAEKSNIKVPTVMLSGFTVYIANKKSHDGTYHVTLVPPTFGVYRSLTETPLLFASLNDRLDHNSYISQGILRAYHIKDNKQSDEESVRKQSLIYLDICKFSLEVLSTQGFLDEESLKKYPMALENLNGIKLEFGTQK